MQNLVLQQQLRTNHNKFNMYIDSLSNNALVFAQPNKWSAAQQVQHIYKSVRPLALGLQLPKFIIKLIWGKANRASKSYNELVDKYKQKISLGGKATAPFVPKLVPANKVQYWNIKIKKAVEQLCKNCAKFTEVELDSFILPHPLLGKVTLREMLFFTIYHVQHHQELIQRDLK
jgi:hypothetical protein